MKFYKDELCNGKMTSFNDNPYDPGKKIFPLFDTPHIFKCFYNIFMTRNEFKCPAFKEFEEINPVFQHIKRIYEIEMGNTVKFAHKLKDNNIASTPIERSNVSVADAIFHESTINALNIYAKKYPEFASTAEFLKRIRTWWNIVNVNSNTIGKAKLDDSRNSISLEDFEGCEYLQDFADWLENWQVHCKKLDGLTKETFTTAIHTSRNLPELANYLLWREILTTFY